MSQQQDAPLPGRRCFVTVGATASFRRLLEEVLSPAFLDSLAAHGFAELVVQTGPDHAWAVQQIASLGRQQQAAGGGGHPWPAVEAVSYTTDMPALMLPCRGQAGTRPRPAGAMVSHAGSGSILDAVRLDVPLIVVANPDLLGNHQAELADAVDAAGWAVRGELGHLQDALHTLQQKVAREQLDARPAYEAPAFPTAETERCGLFDWTAAYANAGSETNGLQLD